MIDDGLVKLKQLRQASVRINDLISAFVNVVTNALEELHRKIDSKVTFIPDETFTVSSDNVLSVATPVKEMTSVEYDALSDDEKDVGLYFVNYLDGTEQRTVVYLNGRELSDDSLTSIIFTAY